MCLYLSFSHICQVSEQSSVGCRPQLHHPRQWGPPGAGVASSCLEQVVVLSHSVVSDSVQPHGPKPARLLCPWDFPGKNTGGGSHAILLGIFPTQGSPALPGAFFTTKSSGLKQVKSGQMPRSQAELLCCREPQVSLGCSFVE
ncbi:unnamed protein product [Rangifer tarandus platyrhynchus]|uniref:Uncharacterized protein n=2 Tax=Rangifer tarandus platyrhynchus TaxID=3082113 RepID=A0ABN8YGH2_RANTA|nr:unnamed protein product [Rangifer tarandus platyrhynchus]